VAVVKQIKIYVSRLQYCIVRYGSCLTATQMYRLCAECCELASIRQRPVCSGIMYCTCNSSNDSKWAKRQRTLFSKLNEKGLIFSLIFQISSIVRTELHLLLRSLSKLEAQCRKPRATLHRNCCSTLPLRASDIPLLLSCLVIANQTGFKVTFITFCNTLYGFCCYSSNGSLDKGHFF
jgi:hypothetical protein